MTQKIPIGIDLGTTNSAIGFWKNEKVELVENVASTCLTPSYVYYSSDEKCVGKMAVYNSGIDPKNVFFDAKRLLAEKINSLKVQEFIKTCPFELVGHPNKKEGKVYYIQNDSEIRSPISPETISTDVLKSLLNDALGWLRVTNNDVEAVITVPAYFNINQKRATLEAANAAGINVIRLLSEPVAAAICYQLKLAKENKLKEGDSIFIFDLGGGTFDVTIMKIDNGIYKVIALGGDTHLGGRDFDQVIAKIIKERLKKQLGESKTDELMSQPKYRYKLMKAAYETKEALSTAEKDALNLEDIFPDAEDEDLTREEFENRSRDLQDKIEECCRRTLYDANMDPKNISHVLLVGGASKMIMVQKILENIFPPEKISKTVSGDKAIAIGATIYAARLLNASESSLINNLEIQDALPLPIGIASEDNRFIAVLEKNSSLPVRNTIAWKTTISDQKAITIHIYEGLCKENVKNNNHIGEVKVTGIPPGKTGEATVLLTLELDKNGILLSKAQIVETVREVKTEIEYQTIFECRISKNKLSNIP